jgi:hypothetical protein
VTKPDLVWVVRAHVASWRSRLPAGGWCVGHPLGVIKDPRLLVPKAHRFPDVVADKRRRIFDPHVAPLNRLAGEINAGAGASRALVQPGRRRHQRPGSVPARKPRPYGHWITRLRIHLRRQ